MLMPPSTGSTVIQKRELKKWRIVMLPILIFFCPLPPPNPKRLQKKGRICGIKVEELEEGKERDMRILDLMVDELAKGKTLKKIFMEE